MGSYAAPAYSPTYQKGLIDNTNLAGAIIIPDTKCAAFQFAIKASTLYDGKPAFEAQLDDNSWYEYSSFSAIGDLTIDASSINYGFNSSAHNFKYPYHIRIVIINQATLGSCIVYLVTQPAPANPLF